MQYGYAKYMVINSTDLFFNSHILELMGFSYQKLNQPHLNINDACTMFRNDLSAHGEVQ